MRKFPWLVYADDEANAVRLRERSERASADLFALAERIAGEGQYLVLEAAVDYAFEFTPELLPPGTIDARSADALDLALRDEHAVLVTAAGIMFPLLVAQDPRWLILETLGRRRAIFGTSMLSGAYFGLKVETRASPVEHDGP